MSTSLSAGSSRRHYDFLKSIIAAALSVGRPCLSTTVIKALNFHAIPCLHVNAGEYRPCPVQVGTGAEKFDPPPHYLVESMMDDMVNTVNRNWDRVDAIVLSSFVLWQMNYIHPFINGNGRTARAACYLVICLKAEKLLAGKMILPQLIKRERLRYVGALKQVDKSGAAGPADLKPLTDLVSELIQEQLDSAAAAPAAAASEQQAQAPQPGAGAAPPPA